MNRLKERIIYWSQLLILPIYGLSFLMPRSKNIWVFGSTFGRRFADNPRYLYLYMNSEHKEIRSVWISHNRDVVNFLTENGYEAYYYHSLKGIWIALRAKVYIFDNYSKDINFWQSGGALKINLWHGSGNKQINHDNPFDKVRHPKNLYEKWKYFPRTISDEKPSHYILATSDPLAKIFASAFRVDMSHVIVAGYPRNDAMISFANESDRENNCFNKALTKKEKDIQEKLISLRKLQKKVLVYLPTFRESEIKFFDVVNLDKLNDSLKQNNYVMAVKLHPKSKLLKEFNRLDCSEIINIDSDVDVYTFLSLSDMLITDYSSIYTDYMLLNKPVVAFQYDRDDYETESRGYSISQDEYMPEKNANTGDELIQKIVEAFEDDTRKSERNKSRDRMFKYLDTQSSERLCESVISIYTR